LTQLVTTTTTTAVVNCAGELYDCDYFGAGSGKGDKPTGSAASVEEICMIAVILAGGVGKRLGDVSLKISKAMLPILGVPITAKIIEQIHDETPIRRFVVVVRSPDQDIACFLRDAPPGRWEIEFVLQPEPLGMADALKKVVEQAGVESDFLLTACDNIYERDTISDLYRAHRDADFDGTMCLLKMKKEEIAGKSAAVYVEQGRIARIVEKPQLQEIETDLASIPLYIFTPRLLEYLPRVKPSQRGEYELQDAIQMLIDDGTELGYTVTNSRRTITKPEDLLSINLEMLRETDPAPAPEIAGVKVQPPVLIEEDCTVLQGSRIGPTVYIARGSTIGQHCRLSNCVVLSGTTVPEKTIAQNRLFY
jgi:NDP-sugar pyrophosphorylase family protein